MLDRPLRTATLLVAILVLACDERPTPAPKPCGLDGPVTAADPASVRLCDYWGGSHTMRDALNVDARGNGYLAVPLHLHLLPDGKLLFHGEEKVERVSQHVLFNDANWLLDAADPALGAFGDAEIPVAVRFPPKRSASVPDGLIWKFDPAEDSEFEILECGGHTFLRDGRLFYVGGSASVRLENPGPFQPNDYGLHYLGLEKAALFGFAEIGGSPRGWSMLPPMVARRWYPTATRLADGRILVSSGYFDTERFPNPSVETFDPAVAGAAAWTHLVPAPAAGEPLDPSDPRTHLVPDADDYLPAFVLPRAVPAGTPAGNALPREVAFVGKDGQVSLLALSADDASERLFPVPGGVRPVAVPDGADRLHGTVAMLLADGRILVAGGTEHAEAARRVDIYDPRPGDDFGRWSGFDLCDADGACTARHHMSGVTLPDGRVLFVGGHVGHGWGGESGDPRAPVYVDWQAGRIRFGAPWSDARPRGYHNVAALLPDGRVLVAGGQSDDCHSAQGECFSERPDLAVFSPDYLTPALLPYRPKIEGALRDGEGTALPLERGLPIIPYGSRVELSIASDRPAEGAIRAALLGLASITHSFDQNQRYVELDVVSSGGADGELVLEAPASAPVAPPGPYLLFVRRRVTTADGEIELPSVARFVFVR